MPDTGMDVFDIVILGFDASRPDSPAAGLQRVFPIDQGTAVRLLHALPATVKRNVPKGAAEQYRAALEAIGAQVELRVPTPPQASAAAAPVAPVASPHAAIGVSRFTGAATLKHGSPMDSAPPLPMSVAHLPTERPPPAPVVSPERSNDDDELMTIPRGSPLSPRGGFDQDEAVTQPREQWGGLADAPKPSGGKAPSPTPGSGGTENPTIGDEPASEVMRRLIASANQGGLGTLSPQEVDSGLSLAELDLPMPRSGWANLEMATLDDVPAPAVASRHHEPTVAAPQGNVADLGNVSGSAAEPETSRVRPVLSERPPVQVFEPKEDTRSFGEALPDAVGVSLRGGGLAWLGLCALIGTAAMLLMISLRGHEILRAIVVLGASVGVLAVASEQALWTLRAIADELDSPEGPDFADAEFGRWMNAGFNLLCFGFATQLPFVMWLSRHRDALPEALFDAPMGLLLVSVSWTLWPVAVGRQALTEHPLSVWNISTALRVMRDAFGDFALLLVTTLATLLLPIGLGVMLVGQGLPAELLLLACAVGVSMSQGVSAALIGHLSRVHPEAFED